MQLKDQCHTVRPLNISVGFPAWKLHKNTAEQKMSIMECVLKTEQVRNLLMSFGVLAVSSELINHGWTQRRLYSSSSITKGCQGLRFTAHAGERIHCNTRTLKLFSLVDLRFWYKQLIMYWKDVVIQTMVLLIIMEHVSSFEHFEEILTGLLECGVSFETFIIKMPVPILRLCDK